MRHYSFKGNEDNFIVSELMSALCGDKIGEGSSRIVYEHQTDPTLVVKIETQKNSMQNLREFDAWREVSHTPYAKWFAPIELCSTNGRILLQKKTVILPKEDYPKKLPNFFTDFKYQNYGMLDGRFVCHDYGTHALMTFGLTKRMRTVEWWE